MLAPVLLSVLFVIEHVAALPPAERDVDDLEIKASSYYNQLDLTLSEKCFETVDASWNYAVNINDDNEKAQLKANLDQAHFDKEQWVNVTSQFPNWKKIRNPDVFRKFKELTVLGSAALPDNELKEYNQILTTMEKIYSMAKICSFEDETKCDLSLDPDLSAIMKDSRNEEELRYVWTQWREVTGKPIKNYFERYVELSNKAAQLNDFADSGAFWLRPYESDSFKDDIEDLWQTLKPFYLELHAYVRAKLRQVYGVQRLTDDGLIPAHLLGNMWAQSWENVYSLMVPYPGKASIDVTEEMKKQGYTPQKMFEISDEFFQSLGLIPMPPLFWEKSVIEKPEGRNMVCHASAWDFCNAKDFRIKQCTVVSTEDFVVVHHEMGHIQYYLQYKDQPYVYRNGANPGFHEAIGDTIALSVKTPKHLKEIGLLDSSTPIDDYETTINFLLSKALEKIAFLPFGYIIDKYRWDIFEGKVNASKYNSHWWKLREEYQGIKAPVERTEEQFDPAAKYHVAANVEYLRYFVSTVIQFQFHRSLCIEAGQYDPQDPSKPLHNCDIYRSKEAGSKLASMLSLGSSKPWPDAMKLVTGQEKMDASAIREYFKPLEDWLKKKNEETGQTAGWSLNENVV